MGISKLLFLRLFRWFAWRTLLSLSLMSFLLRCDLHKIALFHHLPAVGGGDLLFGGHLLWLLLHPPLDLPTLFKYRPIQFIYRLFGIVMVLWTLPSFGNILCFALSSLHSIEQRILDKRIIAIFNSGVFVIVLAFFVIVLIWWFHRRFRLNRRSFRGSLLLFHLPMWMNVLLTILGDVLRNLAGEAGDGHTTAGHDCIVLSITQDVCLLNALLHLDVDESFCSRVFDRTVLNLWKFGLLTSIWIQLWEHVVLWLLPLVGVPRAILFLGWN